MSFYIDMTIKILSYQSSLPTSIQDQTCHCTVGVHRALCSSIHVCFGQGTEDYCDRKIGLHHGVYKLIVRAIVKSRLFGPGTLARTAQDVQRGYFTMVLLYNQGPSLTILSAPAALSRSRGTSRDNNSSQ